MSKPMLTELFEQGYAVLPTPRRVELEPHRLAPLPAAVAVEAGGDLKPKDLAVVALTEQLACRTGAKVASGKASKGGLTIRLGIQPDAACADRPEPLRSQGYLLTIEPEGVALTGNAPAGLFYGVQTLLQLLKFVPGLGWTLPVGRIEDCPDQELRAIHYDTKHHQETLDGVKAIIDRAAHYKINAMLWEIEDKFAYEAHPQIGAPGAFTADEMKELSAYALARHVEIVPILQMPSHNAFIGKHKKYKPLLEHPDNNYMLCPSNPKTIQFYRELLGELIAATPGCRYVHLGTDEPYFLGEGADCPCRAKLKTMGKGGIFAEFITHMATWVMQETGRQVMYWGEHPMTAADVKDLPPGTINSVLLDKERSKEYKKRGIREIVYTPTQGTRLFFPDYWPCRSGRGASEGRLVTMTHKIRADGHRENNILGTLIAAWDDSGLNSETFWLGWTVASAVGWNPDGADPDEAVSSFMHSFYGPSAAGLEDAYLLLHEVVDFWIDSWERVPSRRGPSFMRRYHPRLDLTLTLPHVPDPETLDNGPFWKDRYAALLAKADAAAVQFERLIGLLNANVLRAERNGHNLQVLLSITRLLAHQVTLLQTLARVEDALNAARKAWDVVRPNDALGHMQSAARLVRDCIADRERRYGELVGVWERTRKPKGMKDGRRRFVHIQDDTKNHTGDHTADLGYLVEAARGLDLEGWIEQLESAAARFREKYGAVTPEPDYMMD